MEKFQFSYQQTVKVAHGSTPMRCILVLYVLLSFRFSASMHYISEHRVAKESHNHVQKSFVSIFCPDLH